MSKTTREKIYYKVVWYNHLCEQFISRIHFNHSMLTVQYKINEWVKPNVAGTKLMCFKSLHSARKFVACLNSGGTIFRCHVKNPRDIGIFIMRGSAFSDIVYERLMERFKLKRQHKRYCFLDGRPPMGTIFCDEIMLLNAVN